MSDLHSQLNLLNQYVRTLQRENQSKSNQIKTLTQQNNQLIQECEALRTKSRQSTTIINNSNSSNSLSVNSASQITIQKLQSQLKQSQAAYALLLQQSSQGNQTHRLRADVKRLTEQKYILEQYKQKLEKELRQIGFKSVDSYISKMRQLQFQIQEFTKRIKIYQSKIVDYERKVTLLTNEVTIKSSQIQRLNDKVKSVTDLNTSKSHQYNSVSQSQEYEKKITQLSNQITTHRSQIQRLKQKQSQLIVIQRQNQSLKRQTQNLRRQVQNLNVRISSSTTVSTQISSLQVTINSLKNDQKQWQKQRQQLKIKISDLQTQVVQKSNTIAQLRLRDEFIKSKQSSQNSKDREIQNLNNAIRVLKVEIQDHKRTISYRDSNIKSLQSKVNSNEYSKTSEISNIQRIVEDKNSQINRLIESHNQKITQLSLQIQRYKSISIASSQSTNQLASLKEQNNFLKRESQNSQLLFQQLQRQKQNLVLRIRDLQDQLYRAKLNSSQIKVSTVTVDNSQNELTTIVKQLRSQLQEVKKSNAVIHEENYHMQKYLSQLSQSQIQIPYFGNQGSIIRYHSPQNITSIHEQGINSPSQLRVNLQNQSLLRKSKHYHAPYFKSQVNIQKKRQQRIEKSTMSPVRDVRSPPQQNINNKQKWQNLQRKISALRIQNDELKRTLLYE